MTKWIDLSTSLPWAGKPTVRLLPQSAESRLSTELSRLGFSVFTLEGKGMRSERDFFAEVSKAFSFPEYFGNNWAAFHDCYSEFIDQRNGRAVAVIWRNASESLANHLRTFLECAHELLTSAFNARIQLPDDEAPPVQVEVFFLGSGKGFE